MLIGGHVSTRGGLERAVDNALAIGAEVVQTHPTPPQTWRRLALDDAAVERFRERWAASGLRAHYFHAVYLVNLAAATPALLQQSVGALVWSLQLADRIGADGVIFHPGSHRGAGFEAVLPQIAAAVREVVERAGTRARLVVENSAGQGGCVGCSFDEMAAILDAAAVDAVGVCLDTAHSFASGYDLRTEEDVAQTLRAFDERVGLSRLVAVHANDSRTPLSSGVDRHANIGDGEIGREGFRALLADPRLREVPWLLEVPGAGEGPDLDNVNRLRTLAGLEPVAAPTAAAEAAEDANRTHSRRAGATMRSRQATR